MEAVSEPVRDHPHVAGLNEAQRRAVLVTEGPLMVLAGAGSGKTRMLTARISHLIRAERMPPWRILAVTFTNKAAGEMRERIERGLAGSGAIGLPEVGTFHAVCLRILRTESAKLPYAKPFVVYDDSDQLSLVKDCVRQLDLDEKRFNPKAIQGFINRLKCDAVAATEVEPKGAFEAQAARVYELYERKMIDSSAVDFGEILCATYRLLRDDEGVRRKYQERFKSIHVDEYQDTNRAQYLLLSLLASPSSGGHGNICVVGDEDQSIYRWRGADIGNILSFESDYPGARVVKLEQNYRSTRNIITAASQVISNNTQRKNKRLWTENPEGEPIRLLELADEREEAERVIREIRRRAAEGELAFSDFAVFYRTNAQSRQFEDVLRREKIPYQVYGGLRFYDRAEVKNMLAYFRVVLNPADSVSLKRIINVPGRGIGKTTVEKLADWAAAREGAGVWDAIQEAAASPGSIVPAAAAKKLAAFVAMIRRLQTEKEAQPTLSDFYHRVNDAIGYARELREAGDEESLARIENLEELDTVIQEFDEELLSGAQAAETRPELLRLFLERVSLASDGDRNDPQASAVRLMTLHSSKGLEFPVVFMVGMEEGLFPSTRPWEEPDDDEIEEERRLCYVGMTRARRALFLSSVGVRRIWGQVSYQEPARFLGEIPDELIERGAGIR